MSTQKNSLVFLVTMLALCVLALIMSRGLFQVRTAVQDTKTFNQEYTLTLTDYAGNPVHLFDYRRKVLIAYAWASWCPYCGAEIQDLAALKKKYGDDVQIVAINRAEPPQIAKDFTSHLQNTQGIVFLLDPADAYFKEIGGYAMPEMVFINAKGDIVYHQRGPINIQDVESKIKSML